jgi:hypothetical protein
VDNSIFLISADFFSKNEKQMYCRIYFSLSNLSCEPNSRLAYPLEKLNSAKALLFCGVRSKKFELISPKICRAGGIPPRPPFRPPHLSASGGEATLSDWTISSFSFRF